MNTTEENTTRDMLRAQLDSTVEELTRIWRELDSDEARESSMYYDDFMAELNELPLEVVWEKGEPFAVVLSTGGPHIEIRGGGRHDGMGYKLHGYWAGEHCELTGDAITRTGEHFREYVEGL